MPIRSAALYYSFDKYESCIYLELCGQFESTGEQGQSGYLEAIDKLEEFGLPEYTNLLIKRVQTELHGRINGKRMFNR